MNITHSASASLPPGWTVRCSTPGATVVTEYSADGVTWSTTRPPGAQHVRGSSYATIYERLASATLLPGSVCETCFDAPAILLAPAPWGGEMGICQQCLTDGLPEGQWMNAETIRQFDYELMMQRKEERDKDDLIL